jgi:hypothetical protein
LFCFLGKLNDIYKEYQKATPEERAALEQRYGKIFNRLMDEMASMETIKSTARQCPHCTIFVDVYINLLIKLYSIKILFLI